MLGFNSRNNVTFLNGYMTLHPLHIPSQLQKVPLACCLMQTKSHLHNVSYIQQPFCKMSHRYKFLFAQRPIAHPIRLITMIRLILKFHKQVFIIILK